MCASTRALQPTGARMGGGNMVRLRSTVAVLLAAVLIMAACSSDKKAATSNASSSAPPAQLTASFRGITATEIKIGVAVVDFQCIAQFVDSNQGDDEKT